MRNVSRAGKRFLDLLFQRLRDPAGSGLVLVAFWCDQLGRRAFFGRAAQDSVAIVYVVQVSDENDARDAHGDLLPDSERLTQFGRSLRAVAGRAPELINV